MSDENDAFVISGDGIYYVSTRGQEGPYNLNFFRTLIAEGYLNAETLVCYDSANWVEYGGSQLERYITTKASTQPIASQENQGGLGKGETQHEEGNEVAVDEAVDDIDDAMSTSSSSSSSSFSSSDAFTTSSSGSEAGMPADIELEAQFIWVLDEEEPDNVWTCATITDLDAKNHFVKAVISNEEQQTEVSIDFLEQPLMYCNDDDAVAATGGHSLTLLEHINAPAVLHHLHGRYFGEEGSELFSAVGTTSLVTMGVTPEIIGPFVHVAEEFYGYCDEENNVSAEGTTILPVGLHLNFLNRTPHPWSIAEKSFQFLRIMLTSQTILARGTCGSGKSTVLESILGYLLARNENVPNPAFHEFSPTSHALSLTNGIKDRVMASHIILRSFGHTCKYNSQNATKFARVTNLHYEHGYDAVNHSDVETRGVPTLVGASIEMLLFDKAHVARSAPYERNFNVFYELLSSTSSSVYAAVKPFGLGQKHQYRWLLPTDGTAHYVPGDEPAEAERFQELCDALMVVGFQEADIVGIMQVIVGLLHLSNIHFIEHVDEMGIASCEVKDIRPVKGSAKVLGLDTKALHDYCCLHSSGTRYSVSQALHCRDQLVKEVYNSLVQCVLRLCNNTIQAPPIVDGVIGPTGAPMDPKEERPFIRLLEVPCLANESVNTLDVFLCNYASEKLNHIVHEQYFSNFAKFQVSADSAVAHKIHAVSTEAFPNNNEVLALLESPGWGILSTLEHVNAKGKHDEQFMQRLVKGCETNMCYESGEPVAESEQSEVEFTFLVNHFEDAVQYTTYPHQHKLHASGWTESNKRIPSKTLIKLLATSALPEMVGISRAMKEHYTAVAQDAKTKQDKKLKEENLELCNTGLVVSRLKSLEQEMRSTTTFHINCMVASDSEDPNVFDRAFVSQQCEDLSVVRQAEVYALKEPITIPFSSIWQNVEEKLASDSFNILAAEPEAVTIACLMYATDMPEEVYMICEEHKCVYVSSIYWLFVYQQMNYCDPLQDGEASYLEKVLAAFEDYKKTVLIVNDRKLDSDLLTGNIELTLGITEKVTKLCEQASLVYNALVSSEEAGDDAEFAKQCNELLEATAQVESEMSTFQPLILSAVKYSDKCASLNSEIGNFSKHCWRNFADEASNEFQIQFKLAKNCLSEVSKGMMETLNIFLEIEFMKAETQVVLLALKEAFAVQSTANESKSAVTSPVMSPAMSPIASPVPSRRVSIAEDPEEVPEKTITPASSLPASASASASAKPSPTPSVVSDGGTQTPGSISSAASGKKLGITADAAENAAAAADLKEAPAEAEVKIEAEADKAAADAKSAADQMLADAQGALALLKAQGPKVKKDPADPVKTKSSWKDKFASKLGMKTTQQKEADDKAAMDQVMAEAAAAEIVAAAELKVAEAKAAEEKATADALIAAEKAAADAASEKTAADAIISEEQAAADAIIAAEKAVADALAAEEKSIKDKADVALAYATEQSAKKLGSKAAEKMALATEKAKAKADLTLKQKAAAAARQDSSSDSSDSSSSSSSEDSSSDDSDTSDSEDDKAAKEKASAMSLGGKSTLKRPEGPRTPKLLLGNSRRTTSASVVSSMSSVQGELSYLDNGAPNIFSPEMSTEELVLKAGRKKTEIGTLTEETLKDLESPEVKKGTPSVAGSVVGSVSGKSSMHPLKKKLLQKKAAEAALAAKKQAELDAQKEEALAAEQAVLDSSMGISWSKWLALNGGDITPEQIKITVMSLLRSKMNTRKILAFHINEVRGTCYIEAAAEWMAKHHSMTATQAMSAVLSLQENGMLEILEPPPPEEEVAAPKTEDELEDETIAAADASAKVFMLKWEAWILSNAPAIREKDRRKYSHKLVQKASIETPKALAARLRADPELLAHSSEANPHGLSFHHKDVDELMMALTDVGLLLIIPASATSPPPLSKNKRASVSMFGTGKAKTDLIHNTGGLMGRKERVVRDALEEREAKKTAEKMKQEQVLREMQPKATSEEGKAAFKTEAEVAAAAEEEAKAAKNKPRMRRASTLLLQADTAMTPSQMENIVSVSRAALGSLADSKNEENEPEDEEDEENAENEGSVMGSVMGSVSGNLARAKMRKPSIIGANKMLGLSNQPVSDASINNSISSMTKESASASSSSSSSIEKGSGTINGGSKKVARRTSAFGTPLQAASILGGGGVKDMSITDSATDTTAILPKKKTRSQSIIVLASIASKATRDQPLRQRSRVQTMLDEQERAEDLAAGGKGETKTEKEKRHSERHHHHHHHSSSSSSKDKDKDEAHKSSSHSRSKDRDKDRNEDKEERTEKKEQREKEKKEKQASKHDIENEEYDAAFDLLNSLPSLADTLKK